MAEGWHCPSFETASRLPHFKKGMYEMHLASSNHFVISDEHLNESSARSIWIGGYSPDGLE
jgi:hypothetical protein